MRYLANPKRHDPRSILPSAQSVVSVGLVYNAPLPYSVERQDSGFRSQDSGARPHASRVESFEFRASNAETRHSPLATSHSAHATRHLPLSAADGPRAWAAIEALAPGPAGAGKVETRVFVDTGPIVERAFARLSGIGWMGKKTCLINQEKGSWFFLVVILTNLALAPDLPAPDRCGCCTRCLEACPTGALVEPYVMDASRCIAYFNIELKGSIPAEYREAIGANVFGCDICQDVCPWNRSQKSEVRSQNENFRHVAKLVNRVGKPTNIAPPLSRQAGEGPGVRAAATTALPEFQPLEIRIPSPQHLTPGTYSLFNPPLEALAAMSEADFSRAFAHSPIKHVKYRGWLRNLCVAMGNSGDRRFVSKLRELAAHSDPVVREHAAWALERLNGL
ncbi:MAG: tRNA epoxyqueuosine(34) reductase QueG [Acidobacteria bacterium]|nr:MAG: tRNA epoxyqueuosine(34) reductase QueG [Acidobacteriota bacterium]